MSLENDAQHLLDQSAESDNGSQKKLKITYARDFLLSLSGLDICKKLPRGFNQSILSEFEESSQERPRIGGFSLRRNEYGSSPPTRGDIGNFSRGNHGKWDSRSSGRSDKDSDSQSEWDTDSGKHHGSQPRRPWQVPEHDGLLGSGSFPRPSGYAPGTSAHKPRANDQQMLNKGSEPYQPPRPFKAIPHSRRETDSLNDETFGSSEYNSDDRAEEERKRRASFELMRKEQQKLFQEKQKLNLDKPKDDFDTLAEDAKDEKILLDRSNISNEPMIPPASNNDSEKSTLSSQIPASRPRVPPGFAKNFGAKSLIHPRTEEAPNPEFQDNALLAKGDAVGAVSDILEEKQSVAHSVLGKKQYENPIIHVATNNKTVNILNASTPLHDYNKAVDMNSQLHKAFNLPETFGTPESRKAMERDAKNVAGNEVPAKFKPDHSGSILDKLFGNALPLNDGGSSNEPTTSKEDEAWDTVQSSKFAHWFLEEEKNPVQNVSSRVPDGLLSLIVGGEKGESQVSDVTATEHIPPNFPLEIPGFADGHLTSTLALTSVGNSEKFLNNSKLDVPAVLTCEDLEQSILSNISEGTATAPQHVPVLDVPDAKTEQPKDTDNSASQHLLSLLQKGPGPHGIMSSTKLDTRSSNEFCNTEVASIGSRETTIENAPDSGNNSLTLETLFGTAFMKELQSVGAPVSTQRGPVGSTRTGVSEPHGKSFSTKDDGVHSTVTGNQRQKIKADKIEEHWLGFDPRTEIDQLQFQTDLGAKLGRFDGLSGIRLPEEDSLIINETLNSQNSITAGNSGKARLLSSSSMSGDLTEKLAALNSAFKDERSAMGGQGGPMYPRGPYDVREHDIPYQNIHGQSSAQLHPSHLNHAGPLFHHPLGSHPGNVNSQMKFVPPEGVIHHDSQNRQFLPNMIPPPFHHSNTGLSGFDPSAHNHPMLQQQMQMAGNFPPPHLIRGFPRGGPSAPPHHSNQPGFVREMNQMQGLPLGHQQPSFGGTGISSSPPVTDSGSNHPEAFQRLIERELRSNSKQVHQYGHELDMGFGYR